MTLTLSDRNKYRLKANFDPFKTGEIVCVRIIHSGTMTVQMIDNLGVAKHLEFNEAGSILVTTDSKLICFCPDIASAFLRECEKICDAPN